LNVFLANPRGFCAGVDRAIEIVNRALEIFGAPVYVRHEVVHNRFVVEDLSTRGAIFVEDLDDVPEQSLVIFSAHGVSRAVREAAAMRNLQVFDATCPLVTKVHMEVLRHSREGRECVLVGHRGHPEVEGTMGQYESAGGGKIHLVEDLAQAECLQVHTPEHLAWVTQTTLSVDDTAAVIKVLQRRFPAIVGPRKDDICYATQNRQDAVRRLAQRCDLVLVVGSVNSSNSNRLRELAERSGADAYLVDGADDIRPEWLRDRRAVGVTAGASAPETLVEEVVGALCAHGALPPEEILGCKENINFPLPALLK